MPEFFVHILNWPLEAENAEEAAKLGMAELANIHPMISVTMEEIPLDGYKVDEFDSAEWYDENGGYNGN